jgi:hypothetical protein
MELKSFKNYLKEQKEINEIFPALAALLGKGAAALGGKAAIVRGAASLLATRMTAPAAQSENQPSTVIPSDQPQPAVTLRNPSGGQAPSPGANLSTGRSRGYSEHRGRNNVTGSQGIDMNKTSPYLGFAISNRGR